MPGVGASPVLADTSHAIRAGLVMVITDAPDISGWAGPTC